MSAPTVPTREALEDAEREAASGESSILDQLAQQVQDEEAATDSEKKPKSASTLLVELALKRYDLRMHRRRPAVRSQTRRPRRTHAPRRKKLTTGGTIEGVSTNCTARPHPSRR